MKKFAAVLLAMTLLMITLCESTQAQWGDREHRRGRRDYKTQDQFGDFQINLDTDVLDEYLKYKGATIYPITQIKVTYKVRNTQSNDLAWLPRRAYEDLWFHNEHALGCRRHEQLELRPGCHGTMILEDTPDLQPQMKAVCNAITRLLLDIQLAQSNVTVLAPRDVCDQLSNDLEYMNFHPVQVLTASQKGILLHVISLPTGFDKYFFFLVQ